MDRDRSLDVAVTGIAARFPGCTSLGDWWSALTAGRVLTTRYGRAELLAAGVPPHVVDDPDYVAVRGHLADADRFDNTLFRISPREAELMDPQHRLMLEVAWAALEDAVVAPLDVRARTAVFASATGSGYMRAIVAGGPLSPGLLDDLVHGTEPDFMAGRIAYKLGLIGPALAVQTACSSSLVALHLAVQALLNGDCDQAVVVAAGFDFPQAGYLHLPGGVSSPSGRCRPFSAGADGVVPGSGVAAVVLRRLADASDDGPQPYGYVLGTAVTNDGAARMGYYTPSAAGQEAVIRAAVDAAAVPADSIGYLEAHGTGTAVGDPIEWSAASAALHDAGPGRIAVGAVKANIGHLDAAAGLAGLIKALLVVGRGVVPPVAGFVRPNPILDLDGSPLVVPTRAAAWQGPLPRRAGVSAFGIGGTNAHVVVEQAPDRAARAGAARRRRVIVLSAADRDALARSARRIADHLDAESPDLADVAVTLETGRAALPERLAVWGRTSAEVAGRLRSGTGVTVGRRPAAGPAPLVFLFAGQGTQYPGMARPYADGLAGFDDALRRCLAAFEPDLRDMVRRALLDVDFPAGQLDDTALAQPALFALGWAAADALAAAGVRPTAVAGHSLGEVTASCVAGAFDLTDAASLVTVRGRAMGSCPDGAMLALACAAESTGDLLAGTGIEVSSVNGPDSCVVAGPVAAIEDLQARARHLAPRRLRTTRAFHSRLIEPALPALAAALREIRPGLTALPIVTNVDGGVVATGARLPAAGLVEQARRPVRLDAMVSSIVETFPGAVAVEIGPGRALSAVLEAAGVPTVGFAGPRSTAPEEAVAAVRGALWCLGHPLVPPARADPGRRLHLPGYPFAGPRRVAPEAVADSASVDRGVAERRAGEDRLATGDGGGPDTPPRPAGDGPAPDPSEVLRRAWADLLGHSDLSDESDFFHLGGDSLLITRVARRVNTELGIRVPVRAMLAGRTLGRQSALVQQLVTDRRPPRGHHQ
ncbi:type I polyketide synthase [Actinomycetes bacterium KLBMP 9797]